MEAAAKQIAAGDHNSLALLDDGTVRAWGWNAEGQTTVPSGLADVQQVAAGYDHNFGR
jgi:alpha-tubulin suppressor-like RCC1 family protein